MSEPDDFPKLTLEEVMECGRQAEENVAALRLRVEELTHERDQAGAMLGAAALKLCLESKATLPDIFEAIDNLRSERDQARDSLTATLDRQKPLLESLDKARKENVAHPFDRLPDNHKEHAERWLSANDKTPAQVRWSLYPIGMVGRWIERTEKAERELGEARQARWIPVEERLPDTMRNVGLVIGGDFRDPATGYYDAKHRRFKWHGCEMVIIARLEDSKISHWCELVYPEPPADTNS